VDTKKKDKMNDLCDGVIVSWRLWYFEELFEMLTWAQLDFIKPIGILNTNGFYDALLVLIQTMVDKGFLKPSNQKMLLISDTIDELLIKWKSIKPTSYKVD
jgi:predicted Rossmann-fold nucleotide-binding protein